MESCQVTGWNALEMADSVMKNAKAITNGENNSAFIPCSNDHRDHLLNAAFLCNQLSWLVWKFWNSFGVSHSIPAFQAHVVMPGVHMSEQIKKNGPDVGATSEKVHANRCRCRFCLKLFERMINLLPIYYQSIQNKSKTSCAPVGRSNSLRCLSQAPSIAKHSQAAKVSKQVYQIWPGPMHLPYPHFWRGTRQLQPAGWGVVRVPVGVGDSFAQLDFLPNGRIYIRISVWFCMIFAYLISSHLWRGCCRKN